MDGARLGCYVSLGSNEAACLHAAPEARSHHLVASAEAFAILGPELRRDARLPVLVAVGGVGAAMVAEVFLRAVNAVMEAAALRVRKCLRRRPLVRIAVVLPGVVAGKT